MWNLIKYELKGYYKELAILVCSIIFCNLLLFTRINIWPIQVITMGSFLVAFASTIIIFIWNISLYNRDLYGNTGYLLFTLPQKGYSILTSKILTSFIQMTVVNIIACSFTIFNLSRINDFDKIFQMAKESLSAQAVILGTFSTLYQYIYLLIFIYFCITISRVAIRNKKIGKFGAFVSFVIISVILGKLNMWILSLFPQSIKVNVLTPQSFLQLNQYANVTASPAISFNIAYCIFDFITLAAFFLITSYLLEHKMDI